MGESAKRASRILVVGDLQNWLASGRDLPRVSEIEFVDFDEITPELLERHKPDAVLCPLTAQNFDAVDIAAHLMACGFSGPLRALCPPLPNPLVVVQEMRRLCPGINFDLVEINPDLLPPEGPPCGRLS